MGEPRVFVEVVQQIGEDSKGVPQYAASRVEISFLLLKGRISGEIMMNAVSQCLVELGYAG